MMSSGFVAGATMEFSQKDKSQENKNEEDNRNCDSDQNCCIIRVSAYGLRPSCFAELVSTSVRSHLQGKSRVNIVMHLRASFIKSRTQKVGNES